MRRLLALAVLVVACRPSGSVSTSPTPAATRQPTLAHTIIPYPTSAQITPSDSFAIDTTVVVSIDATASADVERVGNYLAAMIATRNGDNVKPGLPPNRVEPTAKRLGANSGTRSMYLRLDPESPNGAEGYDLTVGRDQVTLVAREPAGLFYGVQTIRQLLPAAVENRAAMNRRMKMPAAHIVDAPHYEWRGMMLDVSRHFLPPEDVKRFIDNIAAYKMNRLHLHLGDDQGWRIEITSHPQLAAIGGQTEVGGGVGGYYTQAQFADIVAYARSRFVTIVPEIDMPAHTNAALASVPELNCDGVSPPLYAGTEVGFSALCVDKEEVYAWANDVIREISALVPTPYFHVGGDEVKKLTHDQYKRFIERVQGIVNANGKQMVGWSEIATANLLPTSIVQNWIKDSSAVHVARGGKVIISMGSRLYIDMKYDSATTLGLRWAGLIPVRQAYDWDPGTLHAGVPDRAILGVEAPLWSETVEKREDFEFLAFPRLLAVSEVGWSAPASRNWDAFRVRLGAQGPRLAALGVNFYRAPEIPWQ